MQNLAKKKKTNTTLLYFSGPKTSKKERLFQKENPGISRGYLLDQKIQIS
ncbi:MAG: hypothetical protein PUK74_02300 [Elusimicrobia bacterium]|nr:hypothetical protein [Elusimicrobiota bacterium]MDY5728746.1 hypothetical protein [Elusimicrobiaceae bacterium]